MRCSSAGILSRHPARQLATFIRHPVKRRRLNNPPRHADHVGCPWPCLGCLAQCRAGAACNALFRSRRAACLRRLIRKRLSIESARRCRERKKFDEMRATAERSQHVQQIALLERAVRVLSAQPQYVSDTLLRVRVPIDVATALAAAGVAGCANGTSVCTGAQCPACITSIDGFHLAQCPRNSYFRIGNGKGIPTTTKHSFVS